MRQLGWALIQSDCSLKEIWIHRDIGDAHVHRGKTTRKQQKGSHLKAKERGIQRNQTCWHINLGTSSLQNFEKTSLCCLSHPVCAVFCYGAPSKLMQWYKKYDFCLWPYRGTLPIVAQTVCSMKTELYPESSIQRVLNNYYWEKVWKNRKGIYM